MIFSSRGELAFSLPGQVLDVADGRFDGRPDRVAHLAQVGRRLLERAEHLPEPRPDRIDRLAHLGDRVAQVVALDRAQADLLDDRVEERGLHAGIDCPGTSATLDRPVESDVDVAHAGQGGLDRDLHVLAQLLDQARRQRDPHPARSVPSTSTRSTSTTLPVSRPATRTGLPMRMPWASRKTTSIVRCGARKPGPSLAMPTRREQPGQGHDHDQADPNLARRRSSAHPGSLPGTVSSTPHRAICSQAGRRQQGRAVKRDRVIDQHEPARVHDQDRHARQAGGSEHRHRSAAAPARGRVRRS